MKSVYDWASIAFVAKKVLESDPSDARTRRILAHAHFRQAYALYKQGRRREALQEAESSCGIQESAMALRLIARLSYPFSPEKSIQAARRVVILDDQSGQAYNFLALLLIRSPVLFLLRLSPRLFVRQILNFGSIRREAIEASSRAVALLPDDFLTRWINVKALQWSGNIRGAREAYRVVLSMERALAHSGLERFRLKLQAGMMSFGLFLFSIGLSIARTSRGLIGATARSRRR